MKKLALPISLVLVLLILVGCVSHSGVLQKQTETFSNVIKEIKPNQNPVGGVALIIIPSDVEIQKNYYNYTYLQLGKDFLDYLNTYRQNAFQFIADAIAKRRIFDIVSVARHNGNPASYPIGNSDFMIFMDVDGWFIKEKNKSLIIPIPLREGGLYDPFDKNKPEGVQLIARTEAFLDELNQQAQKLRAK
jgi:hypothetical protein